MNDKNFVLILICELSIWYFGNRGVVLLFVWQKFRADLNLWAINLKFLQSLENYVTYNLWKFQIDSFKIDPWRTYVKIKVKKSPALWLPGSRDSPVSKVPGSRFKNCNNSMKNPKKIKRPMDISNGTRMNWLMKKTGYKKSHETVPLKFSLKRWHVFKKSFPLMLSNTPS